MTEDEVNAAIAAAMRDAVSSAEVQSMIDDAMRQHEDDMQQYFEELQDCINDNMAPVMDQLEHHSGIMYGIIVFLGVCFGAVLIKYLIDRF